MEKRNPVGGMENGTLSWSRKRRSVVGMLRGRGDGVFVKACHWEKVWNARPLVSVVKGVLATCQCSKWEKLKSRCVIPSGGTVL